MSKIGCTKGTAGDGSQQPGQGSATYTGALEYDVVDVKGLSIFFFFFFLSVQLDKTRLFCFCLTGTIRFYRGCSTDWSHI